MTSTHSETVIGALAAREFLRRFERPPEASGESPGRVNLIGEHTDYNEGWVLPLAIPQRVHAVVAPSPGTAVRGWSAEHDGEDGLGATYELGAERPGAGWIDYVQGATVALSRALGRPLEGFDLVVRSDVPIGAGLASSAALLVAVLRALRPLEGYRLEAPALARIARSAENDFVGARVGIMDPLACLLASPEQALFLDTRTLAHRNVAMPQDVEIVVVDSGIRHRHADGEYNQRRDECAEICRRLGVTSLRELEDGRPTPESYGLPAVLERRLRHVRSENRRVHEAVAAMEAGDAVALGRLLDASHRSLRDDYEVSLPPIDRLVEIGSAQDGVLGGRITGGGFGGATVFLAVAGRGRDAGLAAVEEYRRETGQDGALLLPAAPAAPEPSEASRETSSEPPGG
jgi:galactokinase